MISRMCFILAYERLLNDISFVFYPRLWEVMEWYLVCISSSPMRGYGMISRLYFILAYERLWNDISFVFYPRLWEVIEWYFVCILSSPMRGYGMISCLYFILAYERLWNDISFVFYPRLWEVMEWYLVCVFPRLWEVLEWFLICVLSSPMRGYEWFLLCVRPPFFSSFEPARAAEQWVKIFAILVKISLIFRVIQILVSKKLTPRGMLPQGVNKNSLQGLFAKIQNVALY